jgi:hypothetical protein
MGRLFGQVSCGQFLGSFGAVFGEFFQAIFQKFLFSPHNLRESTAISFLALILADKKYRFHQS